VTGGIAYGIIKLMERLRCMENPILLLSLQKLALLLYWLPISFVSVCIPRISFENGLTSYCGEFVCSTVPSMTITFHVLGGIWLTGFLASAVLAAVRKHRLFVLEKGNVPVVEARYLAIFEECRKQLGVEDVTLKQNDLICAPITAGFFRKRIILPFVRYTDAQLRMVYQHELSHAKNNDLLWKMAGLVTLWVHWFNPVIRLQLKELDFQQEVVCDLHTAINNVHFTKKEYAVFLANVTDKEALYTYTLAFSGNKNQTIRRIEIMRKTVKLENPKKAIIGLCCVCLTGLAVIPATAVSAKTAQLQENWMRIEEVAVELALQDNDYSDASLEEHGYVDGRVMEIEGGFALMPHSASIDLKKTICAGTRHLYGYRSMSEGDLASILAACDDNTILYRIGIKNKETGELTYISGTGTLVHQFQVTESGTYAVYVENCSQTSMRVSGTAAFVNTAVIRNTDTQNVPEVSDTGDWRESVLTGNASAVYDKGNMVSQCGLGLTGKEKQDEEGMPQYILLGRDNQLRLMVKAPLGEEEQKKVSVQIFLDYRQIPFIIDGKTYDTYYIEGREDIDLTKQITLAADIDRNVDHKITVLLLNDLQASAGELLYQIGNGAQIDKLLVCDEKKDKLIHPEVEYETAYQEYEEIFGGIFLTLEKDGSKKLIPGGVIHAKPGEKVRVYYHLGGASQNGEALMFLNIGENQAKLNGKDFLLFQETAKDRVLYGELEMTAPMEAGSYDVFACAVYHPFGGDESPVQTVECSQRFTLSVEK